MCRPSALGAHTSHKLVGAIAFALLATASSAFGQSTPGAPYRDASRPVAERVRDLLGRMTLEEKFWQLFMIPGDLDDPANDYSNGVFGLQISPARDTADAARAHAERINAIQRYFVERTRLGIPIIPFEEARARTRCVQARRRFRRRSGSRPRGTRRSCRASPTAIAEETRSRGIRQVLSPVVNIANDPRWGRVEETYGEDPLLSSRMARGVRERVRARRRRRDAQALRRQRRRRWARQLSDRLRRAAARGDVLPARSRRRSSQGHARSVMSAYNSVDGSPATQNRALLTDKLQPRLGLSRLRHLRRRGDRRRDGAASHRSEHRDRDEGRARRGTRRDLPDRRGRSIARISTRFARPHRRFGDRRGRLARAAREVRARTVRASVRGRRQRGVLERARRIIARSLARRRASRSCCSRTTRHAAAARDVRSIAVIGTDAAEARLGGYSGPGNHQVSILDGIRDARERAPDGIVRYAPGPGRISREYVVVPTETLSSDGQRPNRCADCAASTSTTIASTGAPRLVRTDARVDFGWTLNSPGRGIPFDWYSVRWTGRITAPAERRPPHRRRGQRRLSSVSRRQAGDRQLAEAIVRLAAGRTCRSRRGARTTFGSSTSRARATRA